MCIFICYAVVLVPSDPVRSYHGNLKNVCVCVCGNPYDVHVCILYLKCLLRS
jgi:hypothetical protein